MIEDGRSEDVFDDGREEEDLEERVGRRRLKYKKSSRPWELGRARGGAFHAQASKASTPAIAARAIVSIM